MPLHGGMWYFSIPPPPLWLRRAMPELASNSSPIAASSAEGSDS
jgi:hypothetical protein